MEMMLRPDQQETLVNLKRNLRHGLALAESNNREFVDLFLHMQNLVEEFETSWQIAEDIDNIMR